MPKPKQKGAPLKRRIYRWGDLWGIQTGSDWIVERRTQLPVQNCFIEVVERLDIHAPPPHVEDIWEEDVLLLEDGSEWNGLLSFCNSASAVMKWCARQHIECTPISDGE